MRQSLSSLLLLLLLAGPTLGQAKPYPGVIALDIDATDLQHRIFRVRERIPVEAGPFTLWLPKWLPGNHGPTGHPASIAGLTIQAHGKRLEFKRDPVDVYAFHIQVPKGASELEVRFETITPSNPGAGRTVVTPTMVNLEWIATALYPAGYDIAEIRFKASLTLPPQWKAFSALDVESETNGVVRYKETDFDTLTDSPVFAGKHYKTYDLDPGAKIPVRLNVISDDPLFIAPKEEHMAAHRNLVQQAYKLYNSQHYDRYDFLLALSNQLSGQGLEHHRSSENAVATGYFTEWDPKTNGSDLLPHEYTHSWNGKFRRPADLTTRNFNVPMGTSLLWVYEGQTHYWGNVLAARSGLKNLNGARDALALVVATYAENRPGLAWSSLQESTNDPVMLDYGSKAYPSWQLNRDYYPGSQMMWLEVDVALRTMSKGQKSLDDFAKAFFGVDDGNWGTKTYTFDDVVNTLNNIVPHDWSTFLRTRLDGHGSLVGGIEASGWRLVFKDTPSDTQKAAMKGNKERLVDGDFVYSLGFATDKDGKFLDVRWDSPAFRSGVAVGMTLVAVNDRQYNKDYLEDAIRNAQKSGSPIKLMVKDFDVYRTTNIDYKGGLRYPYLERIEGTTDYLTAIFTPLK